MRTLDFTNLTAEQTQKLNSTAERLKKKYTEYVDACCQEYGNNPLFWATPFVSRNTANDNTFIRLCRIELALELVEELQIDEVIFESSAEAETFSDAYQKKIVIRHKDSSLSIIKRIRKTYCNIRFVVQFVWSEWLLLLATKWRTKLDYNKKYSFVRTHFSEPDMKEKCCDRYYADIQSYTTKEIDFVPVLLTRKPSHYFGMINSLLSNGKNYFFSEKFNSFSDIFLIFSYLQMCTRLSKKSFYFDRINISKLMKISFLEGRINSPAYIGILFREAVRRMKKKEIFIENIVLWYEGRPNDVVEAASIREYYPDTRCVGYVGIAMDEFSLGLYLSKYQWNSGHSPNVMTIPSETYREQALQFCNQIDVICVPILRDHYYLYPLTERKETMMKRILILLPYYESLIKDMICAVNNVLMNRNDSVEVLVKNHPSNQGKTIDKYIEMPICFQPVYLSGSLSDSLENVDVVITTNTSAGLEIIFHGIPLIIFCANGELHHTRFPEKCFLELYSLVYGEDELSFALEHFLNVPIEDNSELNDTFPEVTNRNVSKLFK